MYKDLLKNKIPWIKSRKRILVSILFEMIIFLVSSYVPLKQNDFNLALTTSLFVMFIFWIIIGYILGRYKTLLDISLEKIHILKNLSITLLMMIIFIGTNNFISYKFSLGINNLWVYKFGLTSLFVQIIFNEYMKSLDRKPLNWLLIANTSISENLIKISRNSRIISNLKTWSNHFDKLPNICEFSGIVIDNFDNLSEDLQKELIAYKNSGGRVISVINWCQLYLHRLPAEFINYSDIIMNSFSLNSNLFQLRLKRFGDIVVSIMLLLFLSPVILFSVILIFLEDRNSLIYSQLRTGINQKPYRSYKLRTMKVNAELNGAQWSQLNDKRITRIGNFLRLTRIDELPQLFNVLKGEMSLIGPRPERPEIDLKLSAGIPNYYLRYKVRPGISGWSQVNYYYAASAEASSVKLSYDLFYINNFSLFLDLLIFFKTIKLVLNAKGAIPNNG